MYDIHVASDILKRCQVLCVLGIILFLLVTINYKLTFYYFFILKIKNIFPEVSLASDTYMGTYTV